MQTQRHGAIVSDVRRGGAGARSLLYRALMVGLAMSAPGLHAQTVSAVANGAWDAASTWSNGSVPSAGNSYIVGTGFNVNSPAVTASGNFSYNFGGSALAVQSGGTLSLPGSLSGGTATVGYTIPTLSMASGATLALTASVGSMDRTLQSGLSLASTGAATISIQNPAGSSNNSLTLSSGAALTGGADINLNIDANGQSGLFRKFVAINSANNAYSGNWTVTSTNATAGSQLGGLYAGAVNALGTGSVTLNSSGLINQVNGGLDSLKGVNAGVNSIVQLNGNWTNANAALALTGSGASVTLNGAGLAVSIGNLTGVAGTTINGAGASQRFTVNMTSDGEYAGALKGTLGFTKDGGSALILSGTNTYTGGTTITSGLLQLGNGGASGSVTGDITNNGTLAVNRSDTYQITGVISGTGSFAQMGSGTTVFSGNNTYTGGTTISAGVLQIGNGGATGALVGDVINNGTLSILRTGNITLAGNISGTGSLLQLQSGTTTLTGDNTFTGGAIINSGSLRFTGNTVGFASDISLNGTSRVNFDSSFNLTFTPTISGTGSMLQSGTGTTILTGNNTYTGLTTISFGNLQLGDGGATGSIVSNVNVLGASRSLIVNRSNTAILASTISGTGQLVQSGTGVTVLTAANTYTGGTTINSGTLQLGNGTTAGSIVGNVLDNGTLAIDHSDSYTLAGVVSGSGALTQSGSGTTILTAANTYTGPTNIDAGTLQLGNGGTSGSVVGDIVDNSVLVVDRSDSVTLPGVISGSGSLVQSGSGTTILTADSTYTGGTAINAGTLQLGNGGSTGSIVGNVVDNTALVVNNAGTAMLPGVISGSGSFSQVGTGTTVLSGNNTYTGGTTISAGTLQLGNGGSTGSIVGDVTDNGALVVDNSGSVTLSGVVSGSGSLSQNGTGTTLLTADNTYSGGTLIGAGTLQLGNGGASGSVTGSILNQGALAIDRSDSYTFSGVISGSGALAQIGPGTTVLTADNTYTGLTSIQAGTLQLGNGGTSGSVVGNVLDNSVLVVDRSDSVTLPGVISGSGSLVQSGSGTTILTADSTYTGGTAINAGTLQLGNGGSTGSIVGNVVDNSALVINNASTVTLPGVISGSGSLSQVGTGTTVLTSDNTYTGGTTISAGTLQLGNGGTQGMVAGNIIDNGALVFDRADNVTYASVISGTGSLTQLGSGTLVLQGDQTYAGHTNALAGTLIINGSIQSDIANVASGARLAGFANVYADVYNQGTVWPGNPVAGDTNYGTFTVHGNYIGQGGALALNTYLGSDGSPSDQLIISGGRASGVTSVLVNNTSSGSAPTMGDGILVISALDGATTDPGAFKLAGEVRSGVLDYRLFRGDMDGSLPDNWYLRNEFVVPPEPGQPPPEPELPSEPEPVLPVDPPPAVLPPGIYPIIGPEVATYGLVQPVARQLGMLTLGTMDQRVGDSALLASRLGSTDNGPSAWGRVFGSNINNSYLAFAAPQAKGTLSGIQVGADLWQGELWSGHVDRAGGYLVYAHANVRAYGLVTNAAATGYEMERTGQINLNQTGAGIYWTHYGPGDWYLDAVAQVSSEHGATSTDNARLSTKGVGYMGSLEFGYPFALPQLGGNFVLEPQVQVVWQRLRFLDAPDGLGEVSLGTTDGTSGRLGVRGRWSMATEGGQLWMPFLSLDLWRDAGGNAVSAYDGVGSAPLHAQATRLTLNGGVTGQLLQRLAVYGSLGYQESVGATDNAQRKGFNGTVGLRYTW
ncbi:autotransporter-associated beta strand repeat-containing protein [Dyella sp. ASV21]|uniref:autotransporter-associated beta strand repeat-containing protein n=1 Tax=Dyella sp. ASV21 TaxID=2795114 RepID=UPI0018EDF01F|nr:autotransporter-associated beta strand repeat-containing protein [Dyella sp. ASV21]